MAEKNSFVIYHADGAFFELLDDKDCKVLITAMFAYARGEEVSLTEKAAIAFRSIKEHIDISNEKYEKAVEQRRKACEKRWGKSKTAEQEYETDAEVCDRNAAVMRNDADKDKEKEKEKQKDNDNEKDKEKDKDKEKENVNDKDRQKDSQKDKPDDKDISLSRPSVGQSVCPSVEKRDLYRFKETTPTDFSKVNLSEAERLDLVGRSDSLTVDRYITKIRDWQEKNHKLNSCPFITISRWMQEDGVKPRSEQPKDNTPAQTDDYNKFSGYDEYDELFHRELERLGIEYK